MPNTNIIDENKEKIKKISNIYIRIYNIFFKYIFFIIAIILSFIVLYTIINKQNNNINDQNLYNQQSILASKQNFEKQQSSEIKDNNYEIKIIGGKIIEEDNSINSNNNLILLGGIVLPRVTHIEKSNLIKPLKYFSDKNYELSELEVFIDNVVFNKENVFLDMQTNELAKIESNILNTFSLECLNYNKIYNQICNHYINNYIENFFYYDISKDYSGFKEILEKLGTKKEKICSNIGKYILYSQNIDINKSIFSECNNESLNKIQDIKALVQINNELENKYISDTTYDNKLLNYYKLISIQQIIFREISNGKILSEHIIKYLDFLEKTIKSKQLELFYIDEAYRFNNYYLSDQISKFDDYSNEELKKGIYAIIQKVNSINYGNTLENIPGLETLINNRNIIKKFEIQENTNQINSSGQIEILSTEIEKSNYLIINTKEIKGNVIKINGYIKIEEKNKKNLIDASLELTYNGQAFFVSKIKILNLKNIDDIINKFIVNGDKSLPETYEYLKDAMGFYTDTKPTNNQSNLKNICKELQTNITGQENISINSCSDKNISIKNKEIDYKFTYNGYIMTKIEVSNSTINQDINDNFGRIRTNEENIIQTIINIITFRDKINFKTKYIDQETVTKIEKQIGPILQFAQSGSKLLFETNVKGIDFIINYDKEKKLLGPMYFKNMLINTRPLIIRNTYIELDDLEETKLFKTNPINYIKTKDKSSYFLYQKANQ